MVLEMQRTGVVNNAERYTTVSVTPETREVLRANKRGGQTYSELIREMVDQYDPDRAKT